jgi:hypothetical protein
MITGAIGIIVLFFLIPSYWFIRFSKAKKPLSLGATYGILHLILVGMLAVYIYLSLQRDPEIAMLLFPVYLLDVPSSVLAILFSFLVEKRIGYQFLTINFYIPAVTFLVLGSVQYFFVGLGLGKLYTRLQEKK